MGFSVGDALRMPKIFRRYKDCKTTAVLRNKNLQKQKNNVKPYSSSNFISENAVKEGEEDSNSCLGIGALDKRLRFTALGNDLCDHFPYSLNLEAHRRRRRSIQLLLPPPDIRVVPSPRFRRLYHRRHRRCVFRKLPPEIPLVSVDNVLSGRVSPKPDLARGAAADDGDVGACCSG
ncbi:hypothetical protein M5K25_026695 [Dendrobium thyrsiflorum]|uniref:Uncharacterized protein n=1 Tax=Dendrobium thyrsiflorum TaxID=117978 RepID=A0ABD0TYA3_DENTH